LGEEREQIGSEQERGTSAKGRERPGQVGSAVRPVRSMGGARFGGPDQGGEASATLIGREEDQVEALQ
jgi:hypothetical protein